MGCPPGQRYFDALDMLRGVADSPFIFDLLDDRVRSYRLGALQRRERDVCLELLSHSC